MVVPVEGIEPPLLAEHDFESGIVCFNYLFLHSFLGIFVCMCKRLCKFWLFSHAFRRP